MIHIVDLENYEPTLMKLSLTLRGLRTFNDSMDVVNALENKFENTKNLYQNLVPHVRQKRGLVNFLGSTIKQITGNLDNNDLIEISKTLDNLKMHGQILTNENNEQIKINTKLQNRINRIISELEKQHNQIRDNIIKHRSDIGSSSNFNLLK